MARDDEACAHGIDGADLAAAIVTAARHAQHAAHHGAGLVDPTVALRDRVSRLLARPAGGEAGAVAGGRWALGISLFAVHAAALAVGVVYGDALIRTLPGVMG